MPSSVNVFKQYIESKYKDVVLASEWSEGCVNYLREQFPASSDTELKQHFEAQFLHQDLARSTTKGCIPNNVDENVKLTKIKGTCLFQILLVMDISKSALSLKDYLESKILDDTTNKQADTNTNSSANARPNIPRLSDSEVAKPVYTGGGALKLKLSDGASIIWALAKDPIPVQMFDTPLGAKITVKNPEIRRGIIKLGRNNVHVLPSFIHELDSTRDEIIMQALNDRLSKLGPSNNDTNTNNNTSANSASSRNQNSNTTSRNRQQPTSKNTSRTTSRITTNTKTPSAKPSKPTTQHRSQNTSTSTLTPQRASQLDELHLSDVDWDDDDISDHSGNSEVVIHDGSQHVTNTAPAKTSSDQSRRRTQTSPPAPVPSPPRRRRKIAESSDDEILVLDSEE